ncbi:MAG TPA: sigma 54-interacting transcriptional regulator [Thermodesulfovibrionales bacterium]|nr:sigma 54-interacting transcriptional regulator [Thermodesulfovibrionales bacterium]
MLDKLLKQPFSLANVFETMRDGMMIVDRDGNILFLNKAAEDITGFSREEVVGRQCSILDTDTCTMLTDAGRLRKCDLFKVGAVENKRCRIRTNDGRFVHLLKNAVILRDECGEIVGAVESMTDITSLYKKEKEIEGLKEEVRQASWFMGLLGKGPVIQSLYEQIRNASGSDAAVLICGESGTGKNLVANAVHKMSRRRNGPFIAMNCASLNDQLLESELFGHKKGSFTGAVCDRIGRFEAADSGTMFLDEIGDMPALMQVKLLRVLEEKIVEPVGDHSPIPVDIRLVSATNKDLDRLVREKKFREDLLYRVNSICIRIPPLRERSEDIPVLAFHYLKKIAAVNDKNIADISPQALEVLQQYHWSGNVRQLINAIEHSVIICRTDTVAVSDLPDYVFLSEKAEFTSSALDAGKIQAALARYRGNRTLAARHLGISRVTLWKKIKESGIS